MELFKEFGFEAAHHLPKVPADHRCARMHGHSYRVVVHVDGPLDDELGWVMDFGEISAIVRPVIDQLDHRCLNDVDGLDNPTCEILAIWLWERLKPSLGALSQIVVRETPTSGCTYRGPQVRLL